MHRREKSKLWNPEDTGEDKLHRTCGAHTAYYRFLPKKK